MRIIPFLLLVSAILGTVSLFGCGGNGPDPEYEKQLRAFAAAYHSHVASRRMAPTELNDLKGFWGTFPRVREDMSAGQFIVVWGASVEQSAAENDKYVLGYEVGTPENGGIVLLG